MKIAHGLISTVLCVAAALIAGASPALATEAEPPVTEAPSAILATSATFNGELNPGTATEILEYRFFYARNNEGHCTGVREAPEGPRPEAGGNHKHVSLPVAGLEASTEYSVCLAARVANTFGEPIVGSTVHFTTPASAPVIESERATPVSATSETLAAEVNPENEPATLCVFEYGALTVTEHAVPCEQAIEGGEPETASVALTGLLQDTSYHYRSVVRNATGTTDGAEVEFTSALPPETPEVKPASPVTSSTAVLNAVLNPNATGQPDTYEFLYRESPSECQGEGERTTPTEASAGHSPEPVSSEIKELSFHTQYTFCVLVRNDAGETALSSPQTFTTLAAAPAITGEHASNETATSVDLAANINPDGANTAYHIEYGTNTSYGTSIPVAPEPSVGAADSPVAVLQHVTGLTPNTTYHWRVVAKNAVATTDGVDHSFIYATTGAALPDGRAYELVTPAQHNGGLPGWTLFGPRPEIALNGDRVVLASIQCFAEATSCTGTRDNEGSFAAFTRTPTGWATTALSAPASEYGGSTAWTASAETGKALYSVASAPGGQDDWLSTSISEGTTDIGPATQPSLGPLLPNLWSQGSVETSADLSKLVWTSQGTQPGETTTWPGDPSKFDAYEYAGAGNTEPWLIGVSGGQGSRSLISSCSTAVADQDGFGDSNVPGSISADGRTIFFTAESQGLDGSGETPCPSGSGTNTGIPVPANTLYARIDNTEPDAHTVHISERSPSSCTSAECVNSAPRAAQPEGAAEDGSEAVFASPQQLTDTASEGGVMFGGSKGKCGSSSGTGCNLYLYDFHQPAGEELTDISAGDTSGEGPRVEGVMAISADGSHTFFVAEGVLTDEPNSQGSTAADGADNLYLYERDQAHPAGKLTFVTTLPNAEEEEGNPGGVLRLWGNGPKDANITPNGRFLVFSSNGQLTSEAGSPAGWAQVFRYDALTRHMVRLSRGADGFNDNGNDAEGSANIVPAQQGDYRIGPARNDPTMADDGTRVFFTSPAALTRQALNNAHASTLGEPLVHNIYEWEQAGVGSCGASEANGCVYLISDGHDTGVIHFESLRLVGVDGTGDNVFFEAFGQLAPQDTDEGQLSVYDARVGGGFAPTAAHPCGESCQGDSPSSPVWSAPGSTAVGGQGDIEPLGSVDKIKPKSKPKSLTRQQRLAKSLKACRRVKPRSRRLKCEAAARKKYGAKPRQSTIKGSK